MCLQVEENYQEPENGSLRYKIVYRHFRWSDKERRNIPVKNVYRGAYRDLKYKMGEIKQKTSKRNPLNAKGYHVFDSYEVARWKLSHYYNDSNVLILELRCWGFVAGGYHEEIWSKIKVLREIT